jgi:SAM-dependent methyltransferase
MSSEPKRMFDLARFFRKLARSIKKRIYGRRLQRKFGDSWTGEAGQDAFLKREYQTYEDYLEHQRAKLGIYDLEKYDVRFREALRERLAKAPVDWKGRSVLCLAARIGTEVRAFLDLGCFALGIDLNPGKQNRYVVHGDFHDLQYAPESIDVVFTNSLDHAFDIHRIAREIHKVLKPDGRLIVEAVAGKGEGVDPGFFESFFWSNIDDLVGLFEQSGFRAVKRLAFDYPWKGQQLWFQKAPS